MATVETPAGKPRFAAVRMVSCVSNEKIQPLVREHLATETAIKTGGWQGYSFLYAFRGLRREYLVPGPGK